MPIYAYRCATCGHAKDVLQKMSDPVLSICPVCGAPTFEKQVTAAGFQLKGSGWYVTDFKGDNKKPGAPAADAAKGDAAPGEGAKPDATGGTTEPASNGASAKTDSAGGAPVPAKSEGSAGKNVSSPTTSASPPPSTPPSSAPPASGSK